MLRYILVRIIWIVIVLLTVLTMLFVTIRLVRDFPPAEEKARELYFAKQEYDGYMTSRLVETKAEALKIEEECKRCEAIIRDTSYRVYEPVPIIKQYFNWVKNIVTRWDWGVSTRVAVNTPVFDVIKTRIPITMKINFLSLFVYMPLGFIIGIIAALKKDKFTDNAISLGVMIFISVPHFIVMFLLLLLFGYTLHWLPTQFPDETIKGSAQYMGLILPVLSLSLGSIAGLTRVTRAELTEVLTSDFLLLARTKGLTRTQAVVRHALRNSMVPLIPFVIYSFVGILSGSVITERIYGIAGMGRLYLQALTPNNFDYNLILSLSAIYTFISLSAVLLVDLSYGLIDPRIRMGAKR